MKEIPILFSTPMVQAIQDNRKTMTRRVVKLPIWSTGDQSDIEIDDNEILIICKNTGCLSEIKCPYGQPGDRLWVRETWCNINKPEFTPEYHYKADCLRPWVEDYFPSEWKWKPSIHMPKIAARIWLEVVSVRVERLQGITEEDAVAEGAVKKPHYMTYGGEKCLAIHKRYINEFSDLWDSINFKRGYGWDSNPWLWVVSFRRVANCKTY